MKVRYIHHSCFVVELESEKKAFIFDYYTGTLPNFPRDWLIVFFASHKHFDHYSKKIFEFADIYPNIRYILAKEIRMNEKYMDRYNISQAARKVIMYVTHDKLYDVEDIKVRTLKSTDSGVAYIVEVSGKYIYHAGDLNWWTWKGENEEEAIRREREYKAEISKISADMGIKFDIAFVPLDSRQEERFYYGLDCFMRMCNADKVFPMHMWEDYSVLDKLKSMPEAAGYIDKICDIREFIN